MIRSQAARMSQLRKSSRRPSQSPKPESCSALATDLRGLDSFVPFDRCGILMKTWNSPPDAGSHTHEALDEIVWSGA